MRDAPPDSERAVRPIRDGPAFDLADRLTQIRRKQAAQTPYVINAHPPPALVLNVYSLFWHFLARRRDDLRRSPTPLLAQARRRHQHCPAVTSRLLPRLLRSPIPIIPIHPPILFPPVGAHPVPHPLQTNSTEGSLDPAHLADSSTPTDQLRTRSAPFPPIIIIILRLRPREVRSSSRATNTRTPCPTSPPRAPRGDGHRFPPRGLLLLLRDSRARGGPRIIRRRTRIIYLRSALPQTPPRVGSSSPRGTTLFASRRPWAAVDTSPPRRLLQRQATAPPTRVPSPRLRSLYPLRPREPRLTLDRHGTTRGAAVARGTNLHRRLRPSSPSLSVCIGKFATTRRSSPLCVLRPRRPSTKSRQDTNPLLPLHSLPLLPPHHKSQNGSNLSLSIKRALLRFEFHLSLMKSDDFLLMAVDDCYPARHVVSSSLTTVS